MTRKTSPETHETASEQDTEHGMADTARAVFDTARENPLAVLAGGVALGLIAGLLVPRHAHERKVLRPVGRRLADSASAALRTAKEAGRAEINHLLPGKDHARARVSSLIESAVAAAKDAAAHRKH